MWRPLCLPIHISSSQLSRQDFLRFFKVQIQELSTQLGIKRIVIWGLRSVFNDSYRFVQGGFYLTLKKLNFPTVWIDDSRENINKVGPGDLIFAANRSMQYLPIINGVKYCLHNPERRFIEILDNSDFVLLQVLIKERYANTEQKKSKVNSILEGAVNYDAAGNVLHQSWGAPLLAREFFPPKKLLYKKSEYFVGTIWENELGQGNSKIIPIYREELKKRGVNFLHVQGAPEVLNPLFVRHSAVGAAIVGNWQREMGYTPCRLFKAVSFGRLGLINSTNTFEAYPWAISNEDIPELMNQAFSLSENEAIELIHYQQSYVAKETYENKIKNILKVLISNQR